MTTDDKDKPPPEGRSLLRYAYRDWVMAKAREAWARALFRRDGIAAGEIPTADKDGDT